MPDQVGHDGGQVTSLPAPPGNPTPPQEQKCEDEDRNLQVQNPHT